MLFKLLQSLFVFINVIVSLGIVVCLQEHKILRNGNIQVNYTCYLNTTVPIFLWMISKQQSFKKNLERDSFDDIIACLGNT